MSFAGETGMSNMFTCCMISTNDGSNVLKSYTDADSNGKAEIITYIVIKRPYRPGTMRIEVKVNPGMESNCIPLSHFRKLFPTLSRWKAQGSTGNN